MKKAIKLLLSSFIALALFFTSIQVHLPLHKSQSSSLTVSLDGNNVEAKGFKSPAKAKPKPAKKKKKKKKTNAQLYKDAKKKGTKVKGRHSDYNYSKKVKGLPSKVKKGHSSRDYYGKKGNLEIRRYYGKKGKADLDIHYTDHGNPKKHPKVPHRHKWGKNSKGNWEPGKGY